MTAKEKAQKLVSMFTPYACDEFEPIPHNAKKCALLHCEEVLLNIIPMYTGNLNPKWKFYSEVKAEIEKIQ